MMFRRADAPSRRITIRSATRESSEPFQPKNPTVPARWSASDEFDGAALDRGSRARLFESLRRAEVLDATILALFWIQGAGEILGELRRVAARAGRARVPRLQRRGRGPIPLRRVSRRGVPAPPARRFRDRAQLRRVGAVPRCAAGAPRERQDDWAGQLLDLFRSEPREPAFLQSAVHLMRDLLRCRYGAVSIGERGALVHLLVSGLGSDEIAAIGAAPQGRGLLGLALRTGESLRVAEVTRHPLAGGSGRASGDAHADNSARQQRRGGLRTPVLSAIDQPAAV